MSLPFSAPDPVVGIDDVLAVEHIGKVVDKTNDARAMLGREHYVASRRAGLHTALPVPIGACLWKFPTTLFSAARDEGMEELWSVGDWAERPRWEGALARFSWRTHKPWTGARLHMMGSKGDYAFGGSRIRFGDDATRGAAGLVIPSGSTITTCPTLALLIVYGVR